MDTSSDDHVSPGSDGHSLETAHDLETPSTRRSIRGPTTMIQLTQIRSDSDRWVIEYNDQGQWIGKNATKMVSYIGTCVRNHIPISYASWKNVPSELKEKIFVSIQVTVMHLMFNSIKYDVFGFRYVYMYVIL